MFVTAPKIHADKIPSSHWDAAFALTSFCLDKGEGAVKAEEEEGRRHRGPGLRTGEQKGKVNGRGGGGERGSYY